jgi:hypothetical protein
LDPLHAQLNGFDHDQVGRRALDRGEQQPRAGLRLGLAQVDLQAQRGAALADGLERSAPLAVGLVKGGDGGAVSEPQDVTKVVGARVVERDKGALAKRRRRP